VSEQSRQKVSEGIGQSSKLEKYSRIPDSVIGDPELSASDGWVYIILARYVFQGTIVEMGLRRIARLSKLDKGTVAESLQKLQERGHLKIIGKGKKRRAYHLTSNLFGKRQRAGVEIVVLTGPESAARKRLLSMRKTNR
jgi:hypothetical protein